MPNRRLLATDLAASALVPLVTIWVYEISNVAVLAAQGAQVTLSTAGLLPLGVAGIVQSGLSPLTKVFQVVLAVGAILPLVVAFSRSKLLIAETFVLSSLGVYVASIYWEMLSLLTTVPIAVHTTIFISGTSGLTVVILKKFGRHPRPNLSNLPLQH